MSTITGLFQQTKAVSGFMARLSNAERQALLQEIATQIEQDVALILAANRLDLDGLPDGDPKKDRLRLNESRIQDLVAAVKSLISLPDPVGASLLEKVLPNGLHLKKLAVPLGAVGIIYESRPNVTVDAAALCFRSGNAVILKGGKEAHYTNFALVEAIKKALLLRNLPQDLILLLPPTREATHELLLAEKYVDVLIPRGSDQLIQYVRQHARVPTIETGAGVVHTYVHRSADLQKAVPIVVNGKVSRPSVCNALDCLLADVDVLPRLLPELATELGKHKVQIFADQVAYQMLAELGYPFLNYASAEDFGKEWLSLNLSIRSVSGLDEALAHIQSYSSKHSEAILAQEEAVVRRFLEEVDAAAVYANASTRFTDGGEFGLGAEIGISTQKLHARGPFALEKLVTEKWIVTGDGQIRK